MLRRGMLQTDISVPGDLELASPIDTQQASTSRSRQTPAVSTSLLEPKRSSRKRNVRSKKEEKPVAQEDPSSELSELSELSEDDDDDEVEEDEAETAEEESSPSRGKQRPKRRVKVDPETEALKHLGIKKGQKLESGTLGRQQYILPAPLLML